MLYIWGEDIKIHLKIVGNVNQIHKVKRRFCKSYLAKSPFYVPLGKLRVLVKNGRYKVEYPGDSPAKKYPDYTDNQKHAVLFNVALDDTVDSPNDVETGEGENDFDNPGKIVNKLDEILHSFAPLLICGTPHNNIMLYTMYLF